MIEDIPIDPIHLFDLGIMKKLLQTWIKGKPVHARLSLSNIAKLDELLLNLQNSITNDFERKPRTTEELGHWKSSEFNQFLTHTGPVLLFSILDPTLYQHFLNLHVSVRLLSRKLASESKDKILRFCTELLKNFVTDSSALYGPQFISYNVHNLIHEPVDVKRFGPLDDYSAYAFENYLQKLKNLLRKSAKPLPQIVKRIFECKDNSIGTIGLPLMKNLSFSLSHEHF